MKRVLWVLCAAAVACVAASTGVAGSGSASTITAKRVCTTGQIRCLAMVAVSPAGRVVAAARPSALPSGLTPAQLRTAYGLPAKAASPATVAIVDAYDYESAYSDLTAYSKAVGLPVMPHCTKAVTVSCFQKVNLGAGANSAVSKGWTSRLHSTSRPCTLSVRTARSSWSRPRTPIWRRSLRPSGRPMDWRTSCPTAGGSPPRTGLSARRTIQRLIPRPRDRGVGRRRWIRAELPGDAQHRYLGRRHLPPRRLGRDVSRRERVVGVGLRLAPPAPFEEPPGFHDREAAPRVRRAAARLPRRGHQREDRDRAAAGGQGDRGGRHPHPRSDQRRARC